MLVREMIKKTNMLGFSLSDMAVDPWLYDVVRELKASDMPCLESRLFEGDNIFIKIINDKTIG